MNSTSRCAVAALTIAAAITLEAAVPCVVPAPQKMIVNEGYLSKQKASATIKKTVSDIKSEGYRLTVTKDKVKIEAADEAGFFYARETLKQLKDADGKIPCCEIEDWPAYPWRGVHFDDGRHFFGKAEVKKFLDAMAVSKLNVLHWHITEDQGWRLAIDAYPDLVKYGAVRRVGDVKKEGGHDKEGPGPFYGPFFYTKDDVKEILAYAKARHIRVMPEIELPGHFRAALAAYPEYGCVPLEVREPWSQWGVSQDVLCAGNDKAIRFLEKVLDEVCEMFDSPVIHIGGDECPKNHWKACPKCQARIKEKGLKDEHALQGWVTKHYADYLAKKGRRIIGWDEILDGGVPGDALVMSWRGTKGGIAAANKGHDVVMTPTGSCYLDFAQGLKDDPYRYATWTKCAPTLKTTYMFDPCAGIPEAKRRHVLGGQVNNWAEYTQTPEELDWKCWPRACGLAEALWTAPVKRDYADFARRMVKHRERLLKLRINAAPLPDAE